MTTRTMSEMITITSNTKTAAATVSSERRARGRERETERERHGGEFAQTRGVAGRQGGCFWARNLSLLVEKHESCQAYLGDGQDHLSVIYMHETTPALPLEGKGTKFSWEQNTFSKGAPTLTFWTKYELAYKY